MEIYPPQKAASLQGPSDWFTGSVWVDAIISAPAPARVRMSRVSFAPGARTVWHTHPLGQTLHVLTGVGRVQAWGGAIREIRAGDTVWIPPGEKHWHGAAPSHAMVHLALQESLEDVQVVWLEPVPDDVYNREPDGE